MSGLDRPETPLVKEKNRTVGNHFKKKKEAERWVDIRTAVRLKSISTVRLLTVVLFLCFDV